MAPTIKDVAKRAGVSVITVSRVINAAEYVRAETQARVLAAIEELQYVPNQMASSLRSRQNDTLALVVPDIATTFWTAMARGAEDEAWAKGFSLFLCNTDDDPAKEERYIENLLRRRVARIAIVATSQQRHPADPPPNAQPPVRDAPPQDRRDRGRRRPQR